MLSRKVFFTVMSATSSWFPLPADSLVLLCQIGAGHGKVEEHGVHGVIQAAFSGVEQLAGSQGDGQAQRSGCGKQFFIFI